MSLRNYAAEIGEDFAFQERTWRAERLAWSIVLLLLVGALAGLFSGNPIWRATAVDPDGILSVEFDRFARYGSPSSISIRHAGSGGEITLRLSPNFLDSFAIEQIRPRPERESAVADGLQMVVRVEKGGALRLSGKPTSRLLVSGEIAVEGHPPARLTWFIWP